ncbi:hypothetical protein DPEC_G00055270 [Dallia pectoralis]|uniref:Uncharacterized protein n=1 Tax=Dallia pectoralis TaxID=75939 RepID=A0ACC2H5B1_DALPE|nr:hypothetical protein DPEC_G00055270 [Dallia pectoralis]
MDIQTKVPEKKSNSVVMMGEEESKEGIKEESKCSDFEEEEEDKVDCEEGDDSEDEEEDNVERESKDPSHDLCRLRVEDSSCGSEISSSNVSVEPSVSSVSYGTHSSLNSEVEEEELACSNMPVPKNSYRHLNGHLRDNLRATDSDNEEFCDSIEHLAMDEEMGVTRLYSSGRTAREAKRRSLQRENKVNVDLREDSPTERCDSGWLMSGTGSRSSGLGSGTQLCTNENAAERWIMRSKAEAVAGGDVNNYIAVLLTRLQEDMANVLQRLNTLEALATSQIRSPSRVRQNYFPPRARTRPPWWPFHLSPATLAFSTVWPLIAHWLVQVYLQRKSRKTS